jgi:membrane protein required for colicin V production
LTVRKWVELAAKPIIRRVKCSAAMGFVRARPILRSGAYEIESIREKFAGEWAGMRPMATWKCLNRMPNRVDTQQLPPPTGQPMNTFDAVVYVALVVAVISGFNAGLLRSVATILGYLAAMPVAVAATPYASRTLTDKFDPSVAGNPVLFFGIFLVAGIVLGALLRTALNETVGPRISLPDRLAGCMLGVVRVGLVAVTMVLIFDRIIPPDRQPAFLTGSRLKPILLSAGQQGLKSLPPEVTALIDQLKRAQRI